MYNFACLKNQISLHWDYLLRGILCDHYFYVGKHYGWLKISQYQAFKSPKLAHGAVTWTVCRFHELP